MISWTIVGALAGCDARRRARGRAAPCKRPATPQRARQCSQNVQVIISRLLSTFATLLVCVHAHAADEALVGWLSDKGQVEMRVLPAAGGTAQPATLDAATMMVPLGSLWKLWVFSYLAERGAQEPAYVCAANRSEQTSEERYCCAPGESVLRDAALARSCAAYFSPARLGIRTNDWQAHWETHWKTHWETHLKTQGRSRGGPAWLLDLNQLKPDTQVPVSELLTALTLIAPPARAAARSALLQAGIEGYGREAWPRLGSGMRYKTYSWHRADGSAFGGAAGWLADGTPFWFGARGSSRSALALWAPQLAAALPAFSLPRWRNSVSEASCVDVDFFTRYTLRAVWRESTPVRAEPGDLKGRFRLEFTNGNWLTITSHGELTLSETRSETLNETLSETHGAPPTISGRFSINEYVARVIEREGSTTQPQAARALGIAARSYLLQNAHFEAGCWHIADSSRTQRVSATTPSAKALAAAWFSDEIVLQGVAVRYHRDAAGNNRLAWRDALARAGEGWDFERILSAAYPQATLATLSGREECVRLDAAENWLARAAVGWSERLRGEPGFEPLDTTPKVCSLADGHPYADQQRLRIYARGWRNLNERVTLAHEYLHLALRFHPNGSDEAYVERLARRLIGN